jgi:hypothetical protein
MDDEGLTIGNDSREKGQPHDKILTSGTTLPMAIIGDSGLWLHAASEHRGLQRIQWLSVPRPTSMYSLNTSQMKDNL